MPNEVLGVGESGPACGWGALPSCQARAVTVPGKSACGTRANGMPIYSAQLVHGAS